MMRRKEMNNGAHLLAELLLLLLKWEVLELVAVGLDCGGR